MKLSTSVFLFLASLIVAAPMDEEAVPPAEDFAQAAAFANTITPGVVSTYEVWTGAIRYNTYRGKIFKNGRSTDISTLLTFTFPVASAGKQCSLNLVLNQAAIQNGAKDVDVFSSLAPAPGSRSSWGPGNQRDQHLGRIRVVKPGTSMYLAGYPLVGKRFACPPAGNTLGYELVATGDVTDTAWNQGAVVGAFISYA